MGRLIVASGLIALISISECVAQDKTAPIAPARTWKSANGAFEVMATVVSWDQEKVVLKRAADGLEVAVALEKLSDVDRKWLAALAELEGEWEGVTWSVGGRSVSAPEKFKIIFDRGTYKTTAAEKDFVGAGILQIDPSTSPKQIDLRDVKLNFWSHQIYEISGDTLKICKADFGNDRPADFAPKGEEKLMVYTYKRPAKP